MTVFIFKLKHRIVYQTRRWKTYTPECRIPSVLQCCFDANVHSSIKFMFSYCRWCHFVIFSISGCLLSLSSPHVRSSSFSWWYTGDSSSANAYISFGFVRSNTVWSSQENEKREKKVQKVQLHGGRFKYNTAPPNAIAFLAPVHIGTSGIWVSDLYCTVWCLRFLWGGRIESEKKARRTNTEFIFPNVFIANMTKKEKV